MKVHEQLARDFTVDQLQERQAGISIAIDREHTTWNAVESNRKRASRLSGLRRRYWTLEKAIMERKKIDGIKAIIREGQYHEL